MRLDRPAFQKRHSSFCLSFPIHSSHRIKGIMTLEDFEKSLAEGQEQRHAKSDRERHHRDRNRDRDHSKERSRQHRHRSSHHRRHSSRSRERDNAHSRESRHRDNDGHRHKRSRRSPDQVDHQGHKRRHRDTKEDEPAAAPAMVQTDASRLKRDAWMEAPSALDIDYVHRPDPTRLEEENKPKMLHAGYELKIHDKELNNHLSDLNNGKTLEDIRVEPAQHEVDYTFGDSGSQWRMTKLKGVYREAEETGRSIDEVAMERFGDLRSFDDAREEETELDRRKTYGKSYVGKEKPSGQLFQERKLENNSKRDPHEHVRDPEQELHAEGQGKKIETVPPPKTTQHLDTTALNRLKAQMMKAKLKKSPDAAQLEEQYNTAAAAMSNRKESDVVVLDVMHNPMLAGPRNEVKAIDTKRGRERGQVEANEDMSIEDMVREERKTRGQPGGEGRRLADQIGRDSKFEVSLGIGCNSRCKDANSLPERFGVHG